MSLLYDDEIGGEKKSELNRHLNECAECGAQVAAWRRATRALDRWPQSQSQPRAHRWPKALQWGMAAAFLLAAGFGAGHFTGQQVAVEKLRASMEPQLRRAIEQDFRATRDRDRREMIAWLRDIESQRVADYRALRKDLETVAVLAEDKIQTTQQELAQVAALTQTRNNN